MAHKVSIYLDEHAHRELKAAASRLGQSLSEFMARAALEPEATGANQSSLA